MTLKKYIGAALLLTSAGLAMVSCDDIAEENRIEVGKPEKVVVAPDTLTYEVGGETYTCINEHRLLINDFTGWKCVNCPTVAEYLTSQITNVYPSVLVSLHMTTNSFSAGHPDGYNCESADTIANWINGSAIASNLGLPSVTIDNMPYEGNAFVSDTKDIGNLAVKRYTECLSDTESPILGINSHKVSDDKYQINVLLVDFGPMEAKTLYSVHVWLIEEGLVSRMQQSHQNWIQNYENHGILRQIIKGGHEGNLVQINNQMAVLKCTLDIAGKGYKAENCRVVAFVTPDYGTKVLNTTEVELD